MLNRILSVATLAFVPYLAFAQTPRLAVPLGLGYSSYSFRDSAGALSNALFGPSPDVTGSFSVNALTGGFLWITSTGLGAQGNVSAGRLAQKGMRFDYADPRWSLLTEVNGLYAITDYLHVKAGLHENTLFEQNGKGAYFGLGVQAGLALCLGHYLVEIERLSDSEGYFDLFGVGHTSLKATRLAVNYLFAL